ncbi:hypothetical protein [Aquimarina aquimarini]|uniref:hypothetical protein n=1 Tax=Aquimarina aquimarini TaxID=1191734 RepID=UPI00131F1C80|nr:hypothetical protein [Aquimarina aquimarini]
METKYNTKTPKNLYYLNIELFMTYEIYINDIKIANNIQSGPVSGLRYLNEYILNSGKQTIKLVDRDINPPGKSNLPDNIFEKFGLEVYSTDENEENIQIVKKLDFPNIPTPRPYYYENTWEFDAVVPYNVDGWKKGKDLSKLDEEELEEKVVAKFKHLRNLINNGNVDEFMTENAKGYEEFVITNYYQKKWSEFDENIRELIDDQKGFMLPLENYKIKIHGNGKLVTLERVDRSYLGESALIALDEGENTLYTNYISLYMPEGSHELKPIRLVVDYTIADFSKK